MMLPFVGSQKTRAGFGSPARHHQKARQHLPRSFRPTLEGLEARALLNAGSLDPTFGVGGEVVTPMGSSGVTGLVRQGDGKLVAAGPFGMGTVLLRYNSDGTHDPYFASFGEETIDLGINGPVALALQTDGKILVAGTSGTTDSDLTMVIARFLPTGFLDRTFGSGSGEVTIGPGFTANQVTVQADGKILVGGITVSQGTTIDDLVIVRLNSDGAMDTAFGVNGRAETTISGNAVPIPSGLGVEANGRIVAETANNLVAFGPGGALDSGFGTGGISSALPAALHGMTILPDGRIVVVGNAQGSSGTTDFAIARLFANGILDASFGAAGVTLTDFGVSTQTNAVAVQPDGRYVAAGYTLTSAAGQAPVATFALARYNPNGAIDTTFGTGGTVLTTFTPGSSRAEQVLVQPDGKAVTAGSAGSGAFVLARYTADTPLPTANQRFVAQVYLDLFGRPVDASGLAQWSAMLDQNVNRAQVVLQIESSQEFLTDEINALYAQYLHRRVDPIGLNGSIGFLRSGGTVEELVTVLVSSPEFTQGQGQGTKDGFLNALYQDALNRAVDPGGRAGWDQAFANHATDSQVAAAILASTEYRQDVVDNAYGLFLRRQADPTGLNNFTTLLNQGARDDTVFALILGSAEYFQRVG